MKYSLITLLALCACILTACSPDVPPTPLFTITLDPPASHIVVPSEGGTYLYTVNSNGSVWTVEKNNEAWWCTVTPEGGSDGSSFTIKVAPYVYAPGISRPVGTIKIRAEDGNYVVLTAVQSTSAE